MSDYPAVWARAERPSELFAGRLAVGADRLLLQGRASDGARFFGEIAACEIEGVRRTKDAAERLGRAWLRLDLTSGDSLAVTTVLGVGTLKELFDAVTLLAAEARSARMTAEVRRDDAQALRGQAQHQVRRARKAIDAAADAVRSTRIRGPR